MQIFLKLLSSRILLVCLSIPLLVSKQVPLAQPQAAPAKTPVPKAPQETQPKNTNLSLGNVLELAIAHTTGRYIASPTPDRFAELLLAHEQLVYHTCLSRLHRTLTYNPREVSQACSAARLELLRLHPQNAAGVCARDGFGTPSCRDAVLRVVQRTFSQQRPNSLDVALASQSQLAEKQNLNLELRKYDYNSNFKGSSPAREDAAVYEKYITEKKHLAKVIDRLIVLECRQQEFGLEQPPRSDLNSNGSSGLTTQPTAVPPMFDNDVAAKEGVTLGVAKSITPEAGKSAKTDIAIEPPNYPFVRSRKVSDNCKSVIARARKILPMFPGITCADYGDYTPQCIDALKAWRVQAQELKGTGSSKGKSGDTSNKNFDEF